MPEMDTLLGTADVRGQGSSQSGGSSSRGNAPPVGFTSEGEGLAPAQPQACKAGVLALLRSSRDGWTAEDWRAFFDERAGIAEFDETLSRLRAEEHAFACCIAEWLNRNPISSLPGRCLACGRPHHAHDPLLPYGTETTGHAWLHSRCWPSWYEGRKADGVVVLAAMGLTAPTGQSPETKASGEPKRIQER
jgi:hypothetical protein